MVPPHGVKMLSPDVVNLMVWDRKRQVGGGGRNFTVGETNIGLGFLLPDRICTQYVLQKFLS